MQAATVLRRARTDAAMSLRSLAQRAGTSHSTLAAYESGRKQPSTATFFRIIAAAGFAADVELSARHRGSAALSRGEELRQVLELAEQFPTRARAELRYPLWAQAAVR